MTPPWNGGPSATVARAGPISPASAANTSRGSSGAMVSAADGARARYDHRPRSPAPSDSRQTAHGSSAKAARARAGSRQGAAMIVGGLSVQVGILLPHPGTDGIDAVAREHAAARQQPPVLPVGKPQLRP